MREDVVEHELLDLEVDDGVAVELCFEGPAQGVQERDVVSKLRVAPRRPPASRRRGTEQQQRPRELPRAARPASARMERAVIQHERRRRGLQTLGGQSEPRVGTGPRVLEPKHPNRAGTRHVHTETVSQQNRAGRRRVPRVSFLPETRVRNLCDLKTKAA